MRYQDPKIERHGRKKGIQHWRIRPFVPTLVDGKLERRQKPIIRTSRRPAMGRMWFSSSRFLSLPKILGPHVLPVLHRRLLARLLKWQPRADDRFPGISTRLRAIPIQCRLSAYPAGLRLLRAPHARRLWPPLLNPARAIAADPRAVSRRVGHLDDHPPAELARIAFRISCARHSLPSPASWPTSRYSPRSDTSANETGHYRSLA